MSPTPVTVARAIALGERIDVAGLDYGPPLSRAPPAFRVEGGLMAVFRYGVVVLIGIPAEREAALVAAIMGRVTGAYADREEEAAPIQVRNDIETDLVGPDGVVRLADPGPERLLLVADALAKSAALAQDERRVAKALDRVEPWAQGLATRGRHPSGRRQVVRHIGEVLLIQHRLTERVAAREKPDILWDRPDLERLHARLAAEFELSERAEALERKLRLVGESVGVLTDFIDTERSLRLEVAIVALIVAEFAIALFEVLRP